MREGWTKHKEHVQLTSSSSELGGVVEAAARILTPTVPHTHVWRGQRRLRQRQLLIRLRCMTRENGSKSDSSDVYVHSYAPPHMPANDCIRFPHVSLAQCQLVVVPGPCLVPASPPPPPQARGMFHDPSVAEPVACFMAGGALPQSG